MTATAFKMGDKVRSTKRPEWGVGSIMKIEAITFQGKSDQSIYVRFAAVGVKTLLASAADLIAAEWPQRPLADWRDADLRDAAAELAAFAFVPAGSEGWAKAEVTAGGVSTAALSSKTMETKSVRGLFFVGEAVDVTGWLGGYNFQWAWSSGWAAGQAV